MPVKTVSFSATEDQLDQIRYALVDRIFELEGLLSKGDSANGDLQDALDRTREVALALKIEIG